MWSVNALNGRIWPSEAGVLSIDLPGLTSAVATAVAANVLSSAFSPEMVDGSILELAEAHWPADLDRNGAGWTSLSVEIPLY